VVDSDDYELDAYADEYESEYAREDVDPVFAEEVLHTARYPEAYISDRGDDRYAERLGRIVERRASGCGHAQCHGNGAGTAQHGNGERAEGYVVRVASFVLGVYGAEVFIFGVQHLEPDAEDDYAARYADARQGYA